MSSAAVPAWRAAWLLIRLRLLRLFNLTVSMGTRRLNRGRADAVAAPRTGAAPKKRSRWLVSLLIVAMMVLAYTNLAHQAIHHLIAELGDLDDDAIAGAAGAASLFGPVLQQAFTLELTLLVVTAVLMSVGSRELSHAEWDLEWLVTLPLPTGALLWARIAERTLANPFGLLALWPTCALLAWQCAHGVAASIALGGALALPLLALAALARTLIDTGLRLKLAPASLRNLQAGISLGSMLVFYLAISPAMAAGTRFIGPLLQAFPPAMAWTPPGLVVRLLSSLDPADTTRLALLLVGETAVALFAGVGLLRAMLRQGVVAAGVRESARRRPVASASTATPSGRSGLLQRLSPVQRRELVLLSRDRNFLVQTLVLPVLIVASQWVLNDKVHSLRDLGSSPVGVALASFTVAAYALMLSAFQTLNAEGGALWLLYTFPQDIGQVLRQKARLWGALALAYPLIGFALQLAVGGWPDIAGWGRIAMVLAGVPIFAAIATALGIFACDPLAQDARQRVRPTLLYLYMIIVGIYAYAVAAAVWWRSLVLVVLTVLLAQALWQKARDELPCLLDPAASPPARVSTADGLIAAMLFFLIQSVVMIVLKSDGQALLGRDVMLSYVLAGAATYALVRYVQWRSRTAGVPALFRGEHVARAVGTGLLHGAGAAVLGLAYLFALQKWGLPDWLSGADKAGESRLPGLLGAWLYPLVVLAAPLFEEFIFRGLVFRGLRRSWSFGASALASAAVFAAVHPPVSMLPVFVLGLFAARAYERRPVLLAPMLTHALYNAVVVGLQAGLR
jgi:membrane protease YdiL (CAAX protease family)